MNPISLKLLLWRHLLILIRQVDFRSAPSASFAPLGLSCESLGSECRSLAQRRMHLGAVGPLAQYWNRGCLGQGLGEGRWSQLLGVRAVRIFGSQLPASHAHAVPFAGLPSVNLSKRPWLGWMLCESWNACFQTRGPSCSLCIRILQECWPAHQAGEEGNGVLGGQRSLPRPNDGAEDCRSVPVPLPLPSRGLT